MKETFISTRAITLLLLILITAHVVSAQTETATQIPQTTPTQTQVKRPAAPPIDLTTVPIKDQLNTIESRTRIYDNFRAVREDMFQKIKKNVNDTLSAMHQKIQSLNRQEATLNTTIDSLNSKLNTTQSDLNTVTKSKNSVSLLGMQIDKGAYNSIMWSVIIILLFLLLVGFLVFKRNQRVVINRNKDLEDLKAEFEAYRKTSREAREKMALQHFNELKKLRGE
jgi:chaperonin cofactor prefoldin